MAKWGSSISDEIDRLLNYCLNRSEKGWDPVTNEVIKYYICGHSTQKQVHEAIRHTRKDAFPADEILRNFNSS